MDKNLKAKVLLVDDEAEFIKTLADRLEVRGMKVTGATRGLDAVNLVNEEKFDVIVLDLAMPGMDGLETLKKIKEKDPDAEIIMLSGHGTIKSASEAIKLGAEEFMEKPVDLPDLLEKIAEAKEKRFLIMQKHAREEIETIIHSKPW